jgi:hypothetical protein
MRPTAPSHQWALSAEVATANAPLDDCAPPRGCLAVRAFRHPLDDVGGNYEQIREFVFAAKGDVVSALLGQAT